MKSKKKREGVSPTPAGWQFTATAPLDPRYLTARDRGYPAPAAPPGKAHHVEPWVVGHERPAGEDADSTSADPNRGTS